ncbi:MAG: flagellar filament capping protein FliD, partial [Thiovulaceae bacterium]|nr:flagellar filament capping protein FliD [Sulfurimonadaceae bacterium]
NVIDDMVVGLSFTLESVTLPEQQVVIEVVQDTVQIIEQIEGFVAQYNALLTEIGNMTKFDLEENEKGIFIGENTITSIRTKINNLLTSLDKDGNSIADYGLNFLRTGQLELDKFTLMQKVKNDPENTQQYFKGTLEDYNGKEEIKNGLFYKINLALDDIVNSADGSITNFERSIERQLKRTEEEKKTANKRLDDRYETLANQFADADSAINRMKKGFESVEMQIKQSQASK